MHIQVNWCHRHETCDCISTQFSESKSSTTLIDVSLCLFIDAYNIVASSLKYHFKRTLFVRVTIGTVVVVLLSVVYIE